MTLVSVIIPVFNVAPYLPACLDSVISQTYSNIEIVVVDDGSTDQSARIADSYAERDDRVRVIHKVNGGLSDARNAGLNVVQGDFVMLVDGDDWIDPEAVSALLETAQSTEADVVICGYHVDTHDSLGALTRTARRVPEQQSFDRAIQAGPPASVEMLNFVGYAWNKLYVRGLIEGLGARFPTGVSLVEDILFNAPLLAEARRVAFLEDALIHYVQRPRETLGTRHDPQFGSLIGAASSAAAALLTSWGAPFEVADEVVHDMELARVRWAVRSAATGRGPITTRLTTVRRILDDEHVREVLMREVRSGRSAGLRHALIWSQARGHALPTVATCLVRGAR